MRAHSVLLEGIKSQMDVVLGAVTATCVDLKAELVATEARVSARRSGRGEATRAPYRPHTDDIRRRIVLGL